MRPQIIEPERSTALGKLRQALIAGRNADGGWGYYPGKASRLESTCWALLALGADGRNETQTVSDWIARCQRKSGLVVEDPAWPVNIAFNGLLAFTVLHHRDLASDDVRRGLLAFLISSKGVKAPQSDTHRQNNSLQGWSWVDETFSWVEPTCWGLLALKKARETGVGDAKGAARIAEAERLMIDRTARGGGWNYGNAWVLGKDLRPFVPTTALGLLAMQDRRDEESVASSFTMLQDEWQDEVSATSLALSLLSLGVYGLPVDGLVARLTDYTADALAFGNHRGIAQALFALMSLDQPHAFKF